MSNIIDVRMDMWKRGKSTAIEELIEATVFSVDLETMILHMPCEEPNSPQCSAKKNYTIM